jgi:hypothetical protein
VYYVPPLDSTGVPVMQEPCISAELRLIALAAQHP